MSPVSKITFTDFKGIRKGDVDLERFTILIGRNNSGKSSVLEALFLLPIPNRETPYGDALSTIRSLHDTLESRSFSFLLKDYISEECRVEYIMRRGVRAVFSCAPVDGAIDAEMSWFKGQNRAASMRLRLGERPELLHPRVHEVSEIRKRLKSLGVPETLLIHPGLVQAGWDYIQAHWERVTQRGLDREVARELSRLVGGNYVGMTLEPLLKKKISLNLQDEEGRRIRLGDLGDGAQILATVMLLVQLTRPNLLLWDDLEAHMNPQLLTFTLRWLDELAVGGVQVVASTHSLEVLRYASQLLSDREWFGVRLLTLRDGELKPIPLTRDQLDELLAAGVDVRVAEALL